jgi:hypothetical protein
MTASPDPDKNVEVWTRANVRLRGCPLVLEEITWGVWSIPGGRSCPARYRGANVVGSLGPRTLGVARRGRAASSASTDPAQLATARRMQADGSRHHPSGHGPRTSRRRETGCGLRGPSGPTLSDGSLSGAFFRTGYSSIPAQSTPRGSAPRAAGAPTGSGSRPQFGMAGWMVRPAESSSIRRTARPAPSADERLG